MLQNLLMNLRQSDKIIIIGDMNEDYRCSKIATLLENEGFIQHIKQITHKDGNTIDHIYTKNLEDTKTNCFPTYYSDHNWLLSIVNVNNK